MVSFSEVDDRSKKQRTSRGKQKIEIKKIEKKELRHVAFSKRRAGLFKKCSEFCSMYDGSEFAVIAFSIAGKPFVSGYPSADKVIQRFARDSRDNVGGNWWDDPVDSLELDDLERFKAKLESLKGEVNSRVNEINRLNDAETGDRGQIDDRFCDYNQWLENEAPEICLVVSSGFNRVESFNYLFPDDWMDNEVPEYNLMPLTVYGSCSLDLDMTINCC